MWRKEWPPAGRQASQPVSSPGERTRVLDGAGKVESECGSGVTDWLARTPEEHEEGVEKS